MGRFAQGMKCPLRAMLKIEGLIVQGRIRKILLKTYFERKKMNVRKWPGMEN
jgi:hypothetical protein